MGSFIRIQTNRYDFTIRIVNFPISMLFYISLYAHSSNISLHAKFKVFFEGRGFERCLL